LIGEEDQFPVGQLRAVKEVPRNALWGLIQMDFPFMLKSVRSNEGLNKENG
jgi:hypothetical protein